MKYSTANQYICMNDCTSIQSPFEIPNTPHINIITVPPDYATIEEIRKYFSEEAHIRMIEDMKLEYRGTATCSDCSGEVTIPSNAPLIATIQKYLNPATK